MHSCCDSHHVRFFGCRPREGESFDQYNALKEDQSDRGKYKHGTEGDRDVKISRRRIDKISETVFCRDEFADHCADDRQSHGNFCAAKNMGYCTRQPYVEQLLGPGRAHGAGKLD